MLRKKEVASHKNRDFKRDNARNCVEILSLKNMIASELARAFSIYHHEYGIFFKLVKFCTFILMSVALNFIGSYTGHFASKNVNFFTENQSVKRNDMRISIHDCWKRGNSIIRLKS